MKVSELIEALGQFDGDLEVIMGSDDEGNDYISPYYPAESWAIEDDGYRCGYAPVHDDDVDDEYDRDDLIKVVLM